MRHVVLGLGGALLVALPILGAPGVARAQGVCHALWYDRNAIYARNGYCFRTARAVEHFGPGCFPPYGRLSAADQARVNEIQYQEDRRGCPR